MERATVALCSLAWGLALETSKECWRRMVVSIEVEQTAGQDAIYPYVTPEGRGRAGLRGPKCRNHP